MTHWKIICINIWTWATSFQDANSTYWISIFISLSAYLFTYISSCYSSVSCNVTEISWRALNYTCSRDNISESTSSTLLYAFSWDRACIFCIKWRRATKDTASIIKCKGSCWTVSNTNFINIINIKIRLTTLNTCTISSYILDKISIRTNIHAQFNVGI